MSCHSWKAASTCCRNSWDAKKGKDLLHGNLWKRLGLAGAIFRKGLQIVLNLFRDAHFLLKNNPSAWLYNLATGRSSSQLGITFGTRGAQFTISNLVYRLTMVYGVYIYTYTYIYLYSDLQKKCRKTESNSNRKPDLLSCSILWVVLLNI